MRKSRDKFGRSFTKFQLSCHEEVDAAFSDDEIEEELVDGFTNYRIVCDAECSCSQENVFGIDVATVNLDNVCADCDSAIAVEVEKRWRGKGCNSNVRGAGSSRATFFRSEKNKTERENAARNHSQPLQNFFFEQVECTTAHTNEVNDDNFDYDERSLYHILIDDQNECEDSIAPKKPRRSDMHSVQTGIKAISKVLDYTLKKCKKHRSIPDDIVARVQGDNGEFAKYAASKQRLRIIQ